MQRNATLPIRIGILLALASSSCGRHDDAPAESEGRLHPSVRVVAVQSHDFRGDIEAPGQWKASTETVIQAPFDAILESLEKRPGDPVEHGERIGWWRTYESEAAVHGAELLLEQARDSAATRDANRALRDAKASVVRVPILSPVTGRVLRRPADEGSRFSAGAEVLALVANEAVVFEARVPAERRGAVHQAMTATLVTASEPDQPARVWTLLPSTAGDQSALIWLKPEGGGHALDIGRFGTAFIATGGHSRSLAVPDSAVVEDDLTGNHRVAVMDSLDHVKWIDVSLGPREGTTRAVSGPGLREGLRVIVEDQRALIDGMTVSATP